MSNTRLTVVVRKDLQLSEGLLAAQVAHMSDSFMRKRINHRFDSVSENGMVETPLNSPEDVKSCSDLFNKDELSWMQTPYLSVLSINCYEDLVELTEHAEREQLPVNKWTDTIPSPTFEGKAMRAFVGIAIGPADFDKIKIVTGSLSLY